MGSARLGVRVCKRERVGRTRACYDGRLLCVAPRDAPATAATPVWMPPAQSLFACWVGRGPEGKCSPQHDMWLFRRVSLVAPIPAVGRCLSRGPAAAGRVMLRLSIIRRPSQAALCRPPWRATRGVHPPCGGSPSGVPLPPPLPRTTRFRVHPISAPPVLPPVHLAALPPP